MKRYGLVLLAVLVLSLLVSAAPKTRTVAAVNTYQVTGPVLELGNDRLTVKKGDDTWEIARDANTKITGTIEKGKTVTIRYRMIATEITVK